MVQGSVRFGELAVPIDRIWAKGHLEHAADPHFRLAIEQRDRDGRRDRPNVETARRGNLAFTFSAARKTGAKCGTQASTAGPSVVLRGGKSCE